MSRWAAASVRTARDLWPYPLPLSAVVMAVGLRLHQEVVSMLEFLVANWLLILFVVVFIAMHRGGHGCGMHGHRHGSDHTADNADDARDTSASRPR